MQDEKKLVDVSHHNLKKEHDKLLDAQNNDVHVIEELRKSVNEGTTAITKCCERNADLLKQTFKVVSKISD